MLNLITENLSTLKIHKLSQEQYDRELAAGRIDETALYLTPDEDGDVVGQATEQGGEIFNDYNNNQATAPYSHAQGQSTKATGVASSASGFNTEAAYTHQFVVGRYNDNQNTTLFEVGNGTTNNSRSNAFEVYKDGHAEVQAMGTSDNSVATKQYVDDAVASSGGGTGGGFILRPTEDELLGTPEEIMCTTNYDEMLKALEAGIPVSIVLPESFGDSGIKEVISLLTWVYFNDEDGAGIMARFISFSSDTSSALGFIGFANGTYVPKI